MKDQVMVPDMTGKHCRMTIESRLGMLPGVTQVLVELGSPGRGCGGRAQLLGGRRGDSGRGLYAGKDGGVTIAFVCRENACRSQIAEALAGEMWHGEGIDAVSAGTQCAETVAPLAIQVLEEEGIVWQGKPKTFDQIGQPDVLVTMGCDVICPSIPGVRTVAWQIPDPRGKPIEGFREVKEVIREHLEELADEVIPREIGGGSIRPNPGLRHLSAPGG
ncbi:MAG: hypothetical protein V1800_10380 [Candidatus Latescibacterota bacterium]